MTGDEVVRDLVRREARAQRGALLQASLAAAGATAAAALLLGVSGWFLTGAALAGLAGPAVAHAFNYMLPSAVIRLLAIIRTALRYGERLSGHRGALNALAQIRPEIFRRMAALAPKQLLSPASGEVAARLVQDVDVLQSAFVRRSAPWGAVGGIAAAVLLASLASLVHGALVLVAVLASLAISRGLARRFAVAPGQDLLRRVGELKAQVSAVNQAAPEIKVYGIAAWAAESVAARSRSVDEARAALAHAGGIMLIAQSTILAMAMAGLALISLNTDPALAALSLLAVMAGMEAATGFAEAERQVGSVDAAIHRLGELVATEASPRSHPRVGSDLQLESQWRPFAPPDRLAIVGRSGCGKTSLIERLMALRASCAGEWIVGGFDSQLLEKASVRSLFAYAPQDTQFIAGTIRQNLQLASPPGSDDDLWKALEDAALADCFRARAGLDTVMSDDARGLSGGERRRLALARAYLKPAPWLVLDEPTDGLDSVTEAKVLANLNRRLAETGQGLLLISHRPAAVALASEVVALGDWTPSRFGKAGPAYGGDLFALD
jgi:ATP-binding cassette subfamily C protein CydC